MDCELNNLEETSPPLPTLCPPVPAPCPPLPTLCPPVPAPCPPLPTLCPPVPTPCPPLPTLCPPVPAPCPPLPTLCPSVPTPCPPSLAIPTPCPPSLIVPTPCPPRDTSTLPDKPTPWAAFKEAVVHYKVVVLFLFLAVLCICAGVAVYFATIRKEWINIHLVPHSHDDVGWLRTPDHYYEYTVKYILNNVIHELHKNPDRKFVYVEMYFFWRWWQQQSQSTQDVVRELVSRGQLEFAGGGWTMNDEATPNYQSIIDQFTWGLRRLNDTFGELGQPAVAWQIDTFGHSREMASLASLIGFEGMFFARIDEEERSQRKHRQALEFLWEDRDGATSIITSVMYKHYNPPSGYHYEKETNEGANLDGFLEAVREWAEAYQTPNVLVPMGDDFTYYDARAWFDNMDSLIRQVEKRKNSGINVNMFYSTPAQYLRAVQESATAWPVKKGGDLFPYASDIFSYWTGYYTSRPSLKLIERHANNFLQVVKQLVAMTGQNSDSEERLTELREVMGVLLHHDAITGTAKQAVTDHYVSLLTRAVSLCLLPVTDAISSLSLLAGRVEALPFVRCPLLNESSCFITERSPSFVVTAYNPLSWPVTHAVRLPVLAPIYRVIDIHGRVVPSQMVALPPQVVALPGRASSAVKELVFVTGDIPPLGFTSFYISAGAFPIDPAPATPLSPTSMKLDFNQYTRRLSNVTIEGVSFPVQQDVEYYYGSSFWTGAYIFRPSDPYPYGMGGSAVNTMVGEGPVVQETHQTLGPWASQVLRVYRDSPVVEFEWLVGPIPVEDYHGKEVIARYSSRINSGGVFYTDTNGRGTLTRRRNMRDDWAYSAHEAISGNYYPVTSHISVRDSASQMFVITDRPQGGSSIRNGQLELMLHRRLCYDDGKGVNEPLNETAYGEGLVVRGRHWLLLGGGEPQLEQSAKRLAMELQNQPTLLFAATDLTFTQWQQTHLTWFSGVSASLPASVRILTVEPWRDSLLLLRLEHMFESSSAPPASQPVQVQLKGLFSTFDIVAVRETQLAGDRWLPGDTGWSTGDITVTLNPTAIRTFLVQIIRRQSLP